MKKLLVLSLAACMALSMVACGGSKNEEAAAPAQESETPAEGEAETPDAEPAESGDTSGKKWIIAMDTTFVPFEFTNEKGEFVGIDVDLLAAIAADQGFDYAIQSVGFDAALAAVEAGQADGLLAGASITEERINNGWIFSDGYYHAAQTFAVAQGSDVKSFDDLKGKNVAVKNGTEGKTFAESVQEQYGFEITVFEDSPTMYQDVAGGNSAACVEDFPIMEAAIKTGNVPLEIPEGMVNEGADYGFGIKDTKNQELLDMFNAGLKNIKENGTYDEIVAKYVN